MLLLDVLEALEAVLLSVIEHLVAFNMAEVAHVADISESIVVVEAPLASPVADSLAFLRLLILLLVLSHCLRLHLRLR